MHMSLPVTKQSQGESIICMFAIASYLVMTIFVESD